MKTKQTAEDAYDDAHVECIGQLVLLKGLMYDLPAAVEQPNWSDVATVNEIKRRLADVVEFVAEAVEEDK